MKKKTDKTASPKLRVVDPTTPPDAAGVAALLEELKPGKPSQADLLVKMVIDEKVVLFHNQLGKSLARLFVDDHLEVWPVDSKRFKQWLGGLYWEKTKKVPNDNACRSAINVLGAQAYFKGGQYTTYNRVADKDEAIYYDLADKRWRAIKVTEQGWEIVDPPTLFSRYAHQRPQVEPMSGGDLRDFLRFVNLSVPSQQLLLLVYLVSCFVPQIPHPIPVPYGPQGAAKTTLFRMLRRLIDPSATETLSFPRGKAELVQQLSHHWAPFYDNVSWISAPMSNTLCRAVTGEGFSKRELYSDDDDVIYHFRCCIGLNGINVAPQKPDLLDRSVLFELQPIAPSERKPEKQLLKEFESLRPMLFGAALDALSRAMAIMPSITLPEHPRMADFANWGCAIAPALGYSQDEFLAALDDNMRVRNEEVVASSTVGILVSLLLETHDAWENSATQLFDEICFLAEEENINRVLLPKSANALVRKLNELRTNLAAVGIQVTTGIRDSKERRVAINRIAKNTVTTVTTVTSGKEIEPENDANDANDGILLSSYDGQGVDSDAG